MNSLGVIILAAGKSERMGSPKALLEINGQSFIEIMLGNSYLIKKTVKTVVVLGHNHEKLKRKIPGDIKTVFNCEYEQGKTGSIQTGLKQFTENVDGAFIWPVDCPFVEHHVFEAMEQNFEGPDTILIPSYQLKRGHPPLFGSNYFQDILSLNKDQSLRNLYHTYPDAISHISLNDESILHNINTPESFNEVKRRIERNKSAL